MNPIDTNSNTNPGGDGLPDLTGMTGNGMMSDNGMTMSDSLDSAKDNLTSAGMAAKPPMDGVPMGMDEVGKPSATMAPPEAPLVPADPMPGSIGSVSSGPMSDSTNLAAAVAPTGIDNGNTMTPATPGVSAAGTGTMGATGPMMPTVENTNLIAQAANETPATGNLGYNPFATPTPASGPQPINATNAGAVQPVMQPVQQQPANNAFQAKLDAMAGKAGKNKGTLTLVFAGIAVLAVVAAIIFFVLWMQAKNTPAEIKYVTTSGNGSETTPPENQDAGTTVCTRTLASDGLGMENLLSADETVTLTFADGAWQNYDLYAVYNFTDAAAAAAANESTFVAMSSALVPTAEDALVSIGSSQVIDNHVDYRENFTVIPGGAYGSANVPSGEDGAILTDPEAVRNYYTEQGYTCE